MSQSVFWFDSFQWVWHQHFHNKGLNLSRLFPQPEAARIKVQVLYVIVEAHAILVLKRYRAANEIKEQHADGPHVDLLSIAVLLYYFWGYVVRSTAVIIQACARLKCFGQAEISEFDLDVIAEWKAGVNINQYIMRLDVSVNYFVA